MEDTSSLPGPLASPALMVLATTAEAAAAASQQGTTSERSSGTPTYNTSQNGTQHHDEIRGILPATTASYHQNGHLSNLQTYSPPSVVPRHLYSQFIRPTPEQAIINPVGGCAFKPFSKLENDYGSTFVDMKKLKVEAREKDGQKIERKTEDSETQEGMEDRPESVGSKSSERATPDETRTHRSEYNYLFSLARLSTNFCMHVHDFI